MENQCRSVGLYLILHEFLQTTIFAYPRYAQHMHSLKNIYRAFKAGKDFSKGTQITGIGMGTSCNIGEVTQNKKDGANWKGTDIKYNDLSPLAIFIS